LHYNKPIHSINNLNQGERMKRFVISLCMVAAFAMPCNAALADSAHQPIWGDFGDEEHFACHLVQLIKRRTDREALEIIADPCVDLNACDQRYDHYDPRFTIVTDFACSRPLFAAAKYGSIEVLTALLASDKTNKDIRCKFNYQNALFFAVEGNRCDALEILLDPACGLDVNVQDSRGYTPLMHAVLVSSNGSIMLTDVVKKLLCQSGIKLELRNARGKTARDLAIQNFSKDHEIMSILEAAHGT
jgi:hypothetical protein